MSWRNNLKWKQENCPYLYKWLLAIVVIIVLQVLTLFKTPTTPRSEPTTSFELTLSKEKSGQKVFIVGIDVDGASFTLPFKTGGEVYSIYLVETGKWINMEMKR